MKIVFFTTDPREAGSTPQAGILDGDQVYAVRENPAPSVLFGLLTDPAQRETIQRGKAYSLREILLASPAWNTQAVRDFYAFEQHVKTARARRGLDMVPEWYRFPVFYYSNPHAIYGPEAAIPHPRHSQALDFELEVAAIIGRAGVNLSADEAEQYIAGYTIMNDWSARDVQREEVTVGLGPAKGKDFATSIGPYLVTLDELVDRRSGKGYDLTMIARRNGQELSRGNWSSLYFSFGEMLARASQDTMLYPGDVIGSGTVGTGCIVELGPENSGGWLRPGDVIELEVERLGVLRNSVVEPLQSIEAKL